MSAMSLIARRKKLSKYKKIQCTWTKKQEKYKLSGLHNQTVNFSQNLAIY